MSTPPYCILFTGLSGLDLQQLQVWVAKAEDQFRTLAAKEFRTLDSLESDLGRAEESVGRELEARASYYSPLDWLLFLRCPASQGLLAGLDATWVTSHYAEYFTGLSRKEDSDCLQIGAGLKPNLDEHRYRRLAHFVGGCFVWRELKVFRSLLALGVEFELERSGCLPKPKPTPDQQQSIDIFNRRTDEVPMIIVTAAGVAVGSGDAESEKTRFVFVGRDGPQGFGLGSFGMTHFQELYSHGLLKRDFLQIICDLLLALKVGYLAARNSGYVTEMTASGLLCMDAKLCASLFEEAEVIVSSLTEMFPTVWTVAGVGAVIERLKSVPNGFQFGPTVRQAGNWLTLDLFSASSLLDHLLFGSFKKGCSDRGPRFEVDVQDLIDRTPWKPTGPVRLWRGREVKLDDKEVTDLDALGLRNGILLIVECKATFYGMTYGNPSGPEIRNVREVVETAIRTCDPTKLRSATSPNLAQFSKVIRTVCTPTPVYVEARYAIPKTDHWHPTGGRIQP